MHETGPVPAADAGSHFGSKTLDTDSIAQRWSYGPTTLSARASWGSLGALDSWLPFTTAGAELHGRGAMLSEALEAWVMLVAAHTCPSRIHWCDGSQGELEELHGRLDAHFARS